MDRKRLTAFGLTAILTISSIFTSISTNVMASTNNTIGVQYQGHVQNIGWQKPVKDGGELGTEGRGLRVEALKVKLVNAPQNAHIFYQAYVQNMGWQKAVKDGVQSGTDGKGLRIESLKIYLGNMPGYSVLYRVHVQNKGWMPWVLNGQPAALAGSGLRIEAIEIKIVKTVKVTSVSLNKIKDTLYTGSTYTLKATIAPINATNKEIRWTSSNEKIATVSNGTVKAINAGTAIITATTVDGNKVSRYTVTVKNNGVTRNGVTYTWEGVKSRMLDSGIGPGLYAKKLNLSNSSIYSGVDSTVLIYNPSRFKDDTFYYAFTMNAINMKRTPYMDFGLMITVYDYDDYERMVPGFKKQMQKALGAVCEATFPTKGPQFDSMTNNYKLRTATKGNIAVDLPTVYFFGGRRIFITPHRAGFITVEFSGINDTSNIWNEIYTLEQFSPSDLSISDLKKYMPELKNY